MGCLSSRSRPPEATEPSQTRSQQHIWDILVAYFDMKHGREYSDAPQRKLSQSFGLDSVAGSKSVTSRQQLLSTIDNILQSHSKLKRSADTMFKAFVCAALK